jgi:hypothetical protein
VELGSIRLKVLENLTAGLTGWLYLREQLRPCRLHLAGFGGCRALHAFAQFSATKCSIPHHSATHALGPLLSPRPTRFTTVRFGFRPFPRGQVRDSSGEAMHRDPNVPHVQRAFLCCRACRSLCSRGFGRVSFRRVGSQVEGSSQLQTNPKRSLQLALSIFVAHCSTAALSGDTKQHCVVRCRQLPNQAPQSAFTSSHF